MDSLLDEDLENLSPHPGLVRTLLGEEKASRVRTLLGEEKGWVRTCQEQTRSSTAFVPLESPRRVWPCTFFLQPALLGGRCAAVPLCGGKPPKPKNVHLNRG